MLNRALLKVRRRNGRLHPLFIDHADPEMLRIAGQLLAVFQFAWQEKRHRMELEKQLETLQAGMRDPKFAAALIKLVTDKCEFATGAAEDLAERRAALFRRSGELLKRPPADFAAYRKTLEAEFPLLANDIYGDLPDLEQLTAIPSWTPEELLRRYNVALVQGLLLYAQEMEVTLPAPGAPELRMLARQLKFHRLLARIVREPAGKKAEERVVFTISGPFALFAETRKYALQLAGFFPAVLRQPRWALGAVIQLKEGISETLKLDSTNELLRPQQKAHAGYVPEEFAMFARLFREKITGWTISDAPEVLKGDDGELLIPDFAFTAPDGRTIALELFHRWHAAVLERRLAWLDRHPETPLLLGIDRAIGDEKAIAAMTSAHPGTVGKLFPFRDFPGVERVSRLLSALADNDER